jgi:hypothetical protein
MMLSSLLVWIYSIKKTRINTENFIGINAGSDESAGSRCRNERLIT